MRSALFAIGPIFSCCSGTPSTDAFAGGGAGAVTGGGGGTTGGGSGSSGLFDQHATAAGSNFTALSAFVWDLTTQYGDVLRGDQCTAAGLPISALLPTADEVAAGEVPHALRFILPNARMKAAVYVRPATHAGGPASTNSDAPPYGVRFRLKASFDETPFDANARVILRALKKYGMILSDGGNIALTFADDRLSTAKWANLNITAQTFNSIGVGEFEVVDLGAELPLTYNRVRAP